MLTVAPDCVMVVEAGQLTVEGTSGKVNVAVPE
jgi:hypothetical protein